MSTRRRFRNAVGSRIRLVRNKAGLTQNALAAKLQLSGLDIEQPQLAKIEAGIRSVYDFELAVIARVLRVSIDSLVPGDKDLRALLPSLIRGYWTTAG
jgi:transcriptional regulator with XRE-family HTH domain